MDAALLELLHICLYMEKRDRGLGRILHPTYPLPSLSDIYNPGKQVFSS